MRCNHERPMLALGEWQAPAEDSGAQARRRLELSEIRNNIYDD